MTVFKYFFRILKKSLPIVFLYLFIFSMMSVMMGSNYSTGEQYQQNFGNYSTNITVINRDQSELGNHLKSYLASIHNIVELPDDKERLQDELFYRNTSYILIIPEGFQESTTSGKFDIKLENIKLPDSTIGSYVDAQIDQYLKQINIYLSAGFTLQQAEDFADTNMLVETEVDITEPPTNSNSEDNFYYQFLGYIMIAIIISSISPILRAFSRSGVAGRMESSPFKLRNRNLQLFLATSLLSFFYWMLFNALAAIVYDIDIFNAIGRYNLLNTLALTAVSAAIAFLVGILAKKNIAISTLSTVISLDMSFLCGIFVPLTYMSESVIMFSKFLPLYWYNTNNLLLNQSITIDAATRNTFFQGIGIQIIFVLAIVSVALVISTYKKERPAH